MSYAANPDRAPQRELSSEEFLMLGEKIRQWLTEDKELHAQAQEFALSNAHEFMGENAPGGGEQRFEWTAIHEAYQMQFEAILNRFLTEEDVKPEEFEKFLLRFKEKRDRAAQGHEDELQEEFGEFSDDINQIIDMLMAVIDYEFFMKMMQECVQDVEIAQKPQPTNPALNPAPQEQIDIGIDVVDRN